MTTALIANIVLSLAAFIAVAGLFARSIAFQPRRRTSGAVRAHGFARLPVPAEA
jgi:hypothetical protein